MHLMSSITLVSHYLYFVPRSRIENKDDKNTEITSHVIVNSNGTCRWTYPLFLHVMCSIDVSYFPLDLQKCSLRFGSFLYPCNELLISQPKLLQVIPTFQNNEWMIYETSIKTAKVWDGIRMNNYSIVEVSISMERDYLYFFIEMLLPCFLISCLTILGMFCDWLSETIMISVYHSFFRNYISIVLLSFIVLSGQ